ncbi:polyprenyl synthetase family protein [Bacillaceae bacterium Marseille-Q3522]|nr:polyprenyl synthetase family protein [Bacillaceae bacterium Marseille-Q3522]
MEVHTMWRKYPQLEKDLKEVLTVIEAHLKIHDKEMNAYVKQLLHAGGKMLRPAYSLLCAQAGRDYNREKSIAIAAAIEVLHLATLIHDDVIDRASTRRGISTIHEKFGNRYAIYTGDYLFCICFQILSKYSNSLSNIEFNTASMEKILSGELEQMRLRYRLETSIKDYLKRINGKTAQLFALSCYSGASVNSTSKKLTRNCWNLGHHIGMAFQIIDDILDYTGDDQISGKPVLSDMRQGIYTLPLIYAMKEKKAAFTEILRKKERMAEDDVLQVQSLVIKHKGVELAHKLAGKYTAKGLKEIGKLPDGIYKDQLVEITSQLLYRST